MNEQDFINKLRNSGLRPTKQRIKICEALFNTEKTFHFTVNDLAKIILKNHEYMLENLFDKYFHNGIEAAPLRKYISKNKPK